jgi:hypothetical protein
MYYCLQGGLVPNKISGVEGELAPSKISGVGTIFGLLVHVLPGPNKQRAFEPSNLFTRVALLLFS